MRFFFSAVWVSLVFAVVLAIDAPYRGAARDPLLYDYVTRQFKPDTDARNAVAAVLLNYRMYDTMFEALILLTAIVGMQQFLPRAADIDAGEGHRDA